MAEYDLKAFLTFVTNFTGQAKVAYVGHSQGTTQMFAALSDPTLNPLVSKFIKVFIALAPVVYLPNCTSKMIKWLANDNFLVDSCELFGIEEFLPGSCSITSAQSEFQKYLCETEPITCDFFISALADYNPKYDNEKRFPFFVQYNPSGSSLRSLLHYKQLYEEKKHDPKFVRYDYGFVENEKKYGQRTPPEYDLSLINVPIRGYIGMDDELGDPVDNGFLTAKLQSLNKDYKTYTFNNCGHLTFMWAKDPTEIFAAILAEIQAFP